MSETPEAAPLATMQWGVEFNDGEVELIGEHVLFTTRTPQERAEDIAREQGGTVVTRWVRYDPWTPRAEPRAAALARCNCMGSRRPVATQCSRDADPARPDGLCAPCGRPGAFCREVTP